MARICGQAGLSRLSRLDLVAYYPRYERAEPGELLHLDIKKLGRIVKVGHRITGDPRDRTGGAGWEYVHVAIDDHSRVGYCQMLPDEEAVSACLFLRAAVAYYVGLGVIAHRCASGHTRAPTAAPRSASVHCHAGYTATTGIDLMPAWRASHQPPDLASTGTTC